MEALVRKVDIGRTGGYCTVSSKVRIDGQDFDLWYRTSDGQVASNADPFLAATLLPAMRTAAPLRSETPVSESLAGSVPVIQDIFRSWFPEFHKISMDAGLTPDEGGNSTGGVGCFFSGGVDSFHTLLKHRDEITALIFVRGFDISIDDLSVYPNVIEHLRKAAEEMGIPLIEVETNLRTISDRYCQWGQHFNGCALASVALLLAPRFEKIYIPSSASYDYLHPWGSSPLTDPLWSTGELRIIHDGCEADRVAKVAEIAKSETALKYLRVCWEQKNDNYNCGECEKCLRTKISLHVAGALDRCATFDHGLDPGAISRIEIDDDLIFYFQKQNLEQIEKMSDSRELALALKRSLLRYEWKKGKAAARKHFKDRLECWIETVSRCLRPS